ncbi:MAG: hypothetical protein ABI867_21425 [Kofleriaceae bacterium]
MRWHTAAITVVLACSSRPSTPHRVTAVEVLPDVPFAQLDLDQRVRFMKERVVPAMKPVFVGHDAKRFADFGCKTCHGERRDHAMPNAELPALHFEDLAQHDKADVEWMAQAVKPAMAKLLGADGFGCKHCHPAAID